VGRVRGTSARSQTSAMPRAGAAAAAHALAALPGVRLRGCAASSPSPWASGPAGVPQRRRRARRAGGAHRRPAPRPAVALKGLETAFGRRPRPMGPRELDSTCWCSASRWRSRGTGRRSADPARFGCAGRPAREAATACSAAPLSDLAPARAPDGGDGRGAARRRRAAEDPHPRSRRDLGSGPAGCPRLTDVRPGAPRPTADGRRPVAIDMWTVSTKPDVRLVAHHERVGSARRRRTDARVQLAGRDPVAANTRCCGGESSSGTRALVRVPEHRHGPPRSSQLRKRNRAWISRQAPQCGGRDDALRGRPIPITAAQPVPWPAQRSRRRSPS